MHPVFTKKKVSVFEHIRMERFSFHPYPKTWIESMYVIGLECVRLLILWSQKLIWRFCAYFNNKFLYTQKKNDQHMRVIGLHQNRPAHTSKLTKFRVSYQHTLVCLPACAGKLTWNLVNLLVYAGQLWMCKVTCLCGSFFMQVTSFFFWV